MAYIVEGSVLQTATQATGTTYAVNFADMVLANDTILVKLSQDGSSAALGVSASGFTAIGTQTISGASSCQWFAKIAAGGETSATFACASDDIIGTSLIVRDAPVTWLTGIASGTDFVRTDWNNPGTGSFSAGSLTPDFVDALLIYSACSDGANQTLRCKSNECIGIDRYASGAISHAIGYRKVDASGVASPSVTWYARVTTEGGNTWILAIPNASGGELQTQILSGADEFCWHGNFGSVHNAFIAGGAALAPNDAATGFTTDVEGVSPSANIGTVTQSTSGTGTPQSTWGTSTDIVTNEASAWAGAWRVLAAAKNMTDKIFSIHTNCNDPSGPVGTYGMAVGFSDGTEFALYQIADLVALKISAQRERVTNIALGYATALSGSGTPDWSAITHVGYFVHRATTGAYSFFMKNEFLLDEAVITGGSSELPATPDKILPALSGWDVLQPARQLGAATQLNYSLAIGDGALDTYADFGGKLTGFPDDYSTLTSDTQLWNVDVNRVTITVNAQSTDTVSLSSCLIASDTTQNLVIAAGTPTFAGTVISGFLPNDQVGLTWNGTTFNECDTVTIAAGGDLTNCTISNTTSSNAALTITANGTTVTTSTITVADTSITTAHHISFGASVTSCTLNTVTLSGAAGTDKIYSALASGTLTITTDGLGTSLVAGDVTFVGGSTAVAVIAAPAVYQKVIVSGFTAGSRIQIYDTTNSIELFNGTASAGDTVVSGSTATWTDPTAAAGNRAIRVRVAYVNGATAKLWQENTGLTCGTSSTTNSVTYPITQVADTTYDTNGVSMDGTIFAACGITFTDAATDLVNINIAADTVALKTIYAAFVWWLFTAAGIDDDVAYIDAPNPANYIMTSMKFRNTSTDPLKITDGYFYDSTGSVENCVDITSPGNIYPMPEHVVPYQTTGTYAITGDIADIPTAAENATEVWSNSKALTVGKFLGLK